MANADFSTLKPLRCPLLEQPTEDMCTGDLVKLLAFNTAVLERALLESIIPAGIVSYFGGTASEIPPRSLICDGSFYKKETYPELFEAIRYSYGRDGDGFAVPDLRVTVLQGMTLDSACMDQAELSRWEGYTNNAGAPTLGDVVGARIKHDNTNSYTSQFPPATGQSIYGKMAMVPIISTGELCGRYELVSGGSASCSALDLGELSYDEATKTLTHIASTGKVSAVELTGLGSTNTNNNTNNNVVVASTLVRYGEVQFGDINYNLPSSSLTTTGDFTATKTTGGSLANSVVCVFNTPLQNDEYNVLSEIISLGDIGSDNDLKHPIIVDKSNTGFTFNIEETNTLVQNLQFNFRIESTTPVLNSANGSGDCGKEFYYPDSGISAWNTNINQLVDLNTITGVTVPSWATHAIVHGWFNSAQTATQTVTIGGRLMADINSSGGHSQHVSEFVVPLDGTSLQVDIVNSGNAFLNVSILGFKHVSDTCGISGSNNGTATGTPPTIPSYIQINGSNLQFSNNEGTVTNHTLPSSNSSGLSFVPITGNQVLSGTTAGSSAALAGLGVPANASYLHVQIATNPNDLWFGEPDARLASGSGIVKLHTNKDLRAFDDAQGVNNAYEGTNTSPHNYGSMLMLVRGYYI